MENKHTQQVDFSNPNADKITSGTTNKSLEKKLTAVEWLGFELNKRYTEIPNELWEELSSLFTQAKQMEKEQLENAMPQIISNCVIKEISDDEIEKEAKQTYREHPNNPKEHTDWTYGKDVNFARKQKAFIKGAKWYREQLKKR